MLRQVVCFVGLLACLFAQYSGLISEVFTDERWGMFINLYSACAHHALRIKKANPQKNKFLLLDFKTADWNVYVSVRLCGVR